MSDLLISQLDNMHAEMVRRHEAELNLTAGFSGSIVNMQGKVVTELRKVGALYAAGRSEIAAELHYLATETLGLPSPLAAEPAPAVQQQQPATGGIGDWRTATQRVGEEMDELAGNPVNGRHYAPAAVQ